MNSQDVIEVINALGGPASKTVEIMAHGAIATGIVEMMFGACLCAPLVACYVFRDKLPEYSSWNADRGFVIGGCGIVAMLGLFAFFCGVEYLLAPEAKGITTMLRAAAGG